MNQTAGNSLTKPVSEQQIAGMFDRIAGRYDFLNRLLSARQDERWRKHMVERIPYRPRGRLLDVATGTGDVLLQACRKRTEYAEFIGVDISGEMLLRADKKACRAGRHRATEFLSMSAMDLKFPGESTDCITIAFGLRNVVDRNIAIQEFARVLRPDGKLIILEFFTPQQSLVARTFEFYFHYILPQIGGLFSDRKAYQYLPKSVGNFESPDRIKDFMSDAGLMLREDKGYLFGGCRLLVAQKK